ncbi:tetratricopeptide repeat protein [Tundrisphaera lichenicola]|uniref:tetratricopeptide repeat protein n=1 Tax=Tundrisphaera lichenicola TaxID=2029860 RepID=UPI003EB8FCB9
MGNWPRRGLIGFLAISATIAASWFVVWPALDPLSQGRSAYRRGDWANASKIASLRLKNDPRDMNALRLFARSEARAGRHTSAQRSFVRLGPNSWKAEDYVLLAMGFRDQGRTALARNSLNNARKLDPSEPDVIEQIARFTFAEGRPIEASGIARELVKLTEGELRGHLILADALREANDPAGEAAALEVALRIDPNLAESSFGPALARKHLARDFLRLGRPAEARRELESVAKGQNDREIDWLLSRVFLQIGDLRKAATALGRSGRFGEEDLTRHEPAPFIGAATCARCHEEIHRTQRASRHASTLGIGPELPRLVSTRRPIIDPFEPKAVHTLRSEADHLYYETTYEGRRDRALVEYAFGSGDRGRTLVGIDSAKVFRELRLSLYSIESWDLTTGQSAHPSSPGERLGRPMDLDELRRCLGCHTTQTIMVDGHPRPDTLDRGIGCERCHGPGGHHLQSVSLGFLDPSIARPKHAPAEQIVELCGQCHDTPIKSSTLSGPDAARFQASALKLSSCYLESKGGLSCVTCHDPHKDVERSDLFYASKCRSCHDAPNDSVAGLPHDGTSSKICPVNPVEGCTGCHMPKVGGAMLHSEFSDHQIRVPQPK